MCKTSRVYLALSLWLVFHASVFAQDNRVSRYLTVEPVADESARFPLMSVGDISFSSKVQTVRDALNAVLEGTGYSIAPDAILDPASLTMLGSTVAASQRSLRTVTPLNAMAALIGPGFEVIVDPLSRRVAFDVCLHSPETIGQKTEKSTW